MEISASLPYGMEAPVIDILDSRLFWCAS